MSEDENISLTVHRVQGLSLCPAKTKAEWHWVLMATTSRALLCRQESHRAGSRAVHLPRAQESTTCDCSQGWETQNRQAQGGNGGCHQRDFQGWENTFWGCAWAEAQCEAPWTEGCIGRKAPLPPPMFSQMTEGCMRKGQEGRKESTAPLPSPPPKQRHLLPSSFRVPPEKQQREEAGLGKKDLWPQPTCSHSLGEKK